MTEPTAAGLPLRRDVLLRDVPQATLDRIDAHANEAGVTRATYLRRILDALAGHPR